MISIIPILMFLNENHDELVGGKVGEITGLNVFRHILHIESLGK